MDIQKLIENLLLISSVIPDYTEGRSRGLTDEETEMLALEAVSEAIELLENNSKKRDKQCCEHNLRYIPTEPAGAIDDITECFWCDGRMARLKDGAICSECGWVHKKERK